MLDHLKAVKSLELPEGTYIVVGGSCLDVKDIRKSDDIDMVVTPETFELLRARGWQVDTAFKEKWGRERLTQGPFEIYTELSLEGLGGFASSYEVIDKAEFIEGVPFMTLSELVFFKQVNGRQKDLDDIVLIENYLHTHA